LLAVTVDHDSPEPAYSQLAGLLRGRIAAGEWTSGPLPSVRSLQEDYGVGRDTALRSLAILAEEGLIFSVKRRGYYVRRPD
jgi:DNA-binding GntR family transcriptional regulator